MRALSDRADVLVVSAVPEIRVRTHGILGGDQMGEGVDSRACIVGHLDRLTKVIGGVEFITRSRVELGFPEARGLERHVF